MQTVTEACDKTGWFLHAFVLMPNHFRFVLETPQANWVAGMKWLLGTYTGESGHRRAVARGNSDERRVDCGSPIHG